MTFDLTGNFAYVTSQRTENSTVQGIYGGAIDPASGNLTTVAGSPFNASTAAQFGAVEASQGKFLLEAINGSPDLQLVPFAIDPTTGALTLVSGASGTLPSHTPSRRWWSSRHPCRQTDRGGALDDLRCIARGLRAS